MAYNGWANWDTWAVNLVISDDQSYCDMIAGWIEGYASAGMPLSDAKDALADEIKDLVEEEYSIALDEISSPIIHELVCAMDLDNIDYDEIADGFLDGYSPDNDGDDGDFCSSYSSRRSYNAKPTAKRAGAYRRR